MSNVPWVNLGIIYKISKFNVFFYKPTNVNLGYRGKKFISKNIVFSFTYIGYPLQGFTYWLDIEPKSLKRANVPRGIPEAC